MRRFVLLLLVLLVLPLRAQEWAPFTPPDSSFTVDLPVPPTVLASDPGMLWQCGVKGEWGVVLGWTPFPELETDADKLGPTLIAYADGYVKSAGYQETGRKTVQVDGQPGLDIEASKNGVPVRSLLFLSPPEKRGYALVVFGKLDTDRFFGSFKFKKAS